MHLGGWLLFLLIIYWVFWSEEVHHALLLAFAIASSVAIIFYTHSYILKRYFTKSRFGRYIMTLLVLLLVAPFLFLLIFAVELRDAQDFFVYLPPSLLAVFIIVVASGILHGIQEWFIKTLTRKEIEQENITAELLYLKS